MVSHLDMVLTFCFSDSILFLIDFSPFQILHKTNMMYLPHVFWFSYLNWLIEFHSIKFSNIYLMWYWYDFNWLNILFFSCCCHFLYMCTRIIYFVLRYVREKKKELIFVLIFCFRFGIMKIGSVLWHWMGMMMLWSLSCAGISICSLVHWIAR